MTPGGSPLRVLARCHPGHAARLRPVSASAGRGVLSFPLCSLSEEQDALGAPRPDDAPMDPTIAVALLGIGGTLAAGLLASVAQHLIQRKHQTRIDVTAELGRRDQQIVEAVAAVSGFISTTTITRAWLRHMDPKPEMFFEMHSVMGPAANRLMVALTSITTWRGGDEAIRDHAYELQLAADGVVLAVGVSDEAFQERVEELQESLKRFRTLVNNRDRAQPRQRLWGRERRRLSAES